MHAQALCALANIAPATAAAPAAAGAACVAAYGSLFLPYAARQRRGHRRWARTLARALPWADVPAWMATALLMVQPVLQLVRTI